MCVFIIEKAKFFTILNVMSKDMVIHWFAIPITNDFFVYFFCFFFAFYFFWLQFLLYWFLGNDKKKIIFDSINNLNICFCWFLVFKYIWIFVRESIRFSNIFKYSFRPFVKYLLIPAWYMIKVIPEEIKLLAWVMLSAF